MIFIDTDTLEPPDGWQSKADAALQALVDAPDAAARWDVLTKNSGLWAELGPTLRRLSAGKCWYCESRELRSDMPVDHYRPKARPAEAAADHPGYWWLAFASSNYRLSCTYCNSRRVDKEGGTAGGKQSHFPLATEADRAFDPSGGTGGERPVLLDPTTKADPGLLDFDLDGRAVPHPRVCPTASVNHFRADTSIELLHLNHAGIRERRKRLNKELGRAFQRALDAAAGWAAGDQAARTAFTDAMDFMGRAVADSAELSATARAYLRGKRGDGAKAELLLEHLGL